MINLDIKPNYSAEIRLRLEADGITWPIAKLGPNCFVPAKPLNLSPGNAEIVMTVDNEERRWRVRLIEGAFLFDSNVRIGYENR